MSAAWIPSTLASAEPSAQLGGDGGGSCADPIGFAFFAFVILLFVLAARSGDAGRAGWTYASAGRSGVPGDGWPERGRGTEGAAPVTWGRAGSSRGGGARGSW